MIKKLLFVILTFVACFSFFGKNISAVEVSTDAAESKQANVVIGKDEVINKDLFLGGTTVTISGIVNGDVFAGANSIVVDGTINGDLLAGANTITISGQVTDDVRIGGNNISISGIIGKNLNIFGNALTISKEAQISGSILAGGQLFSLDAPVGKDLTVYAQEVNLASLVNRDFKGAFENINFAKGAQVLGNFDYQSSQEVEIEEGIVLGEINYEKTKEKAFLKDKDLFKNFAPFAFFGFLTVSIYLKFVAFLIAIGLGLLFLYLFSKRTKGVIDVIQKRPLGSLGVGILTPIIFVFLLIFLAVSIVGIPFLMLLIPLFILLVYFAKIFVAFFIGQKILANSKIKNTLGWGLVIGLLIYYVLSILPIIGGIVNFVFITVGLGAFVLSVKASYRNSRKK